MPRAKRERHEAPIYDAVAEQIRESMIALGRDPDATPTRAQRRRQEKARRRIERYRRAWAAMPFAERKAWADAHLASLRRHNPQAKMPTAAELPLSYAIVRLAERASRKAARAEVKEAAEDIDEPVKSRVARVERPAPAKEAPAARAEPSKPRTRRSGPRYGTAAIRLPGGRLVAPIYDEDD